MHHADDSIVTIPWWDSLGELLGDQVNQQVEECLSESDIVGECPQELSGSLDVVVVSNQNVGEDELLQIECVEDLSNIS